MATILCFDKNLPESNSSDTDRKVSFIATLKKGDDQTVTLARTRIVNVERDDEPSDSIKEGALTMYFEETDGRVWYICFDNEELDLFKKVS
jgi:hypothetical protein